MDILSLNCNFWALKRESHMRHLAWVTGKACSQGLYLCAYLREASHQRQAWILMSLQLCCLHRGMLAWTVHSQKCNLHPDWCDTKRTKSGPLFSVEALPEKRDHKWGQRIFERGLCRTISEISWHRPTRKFKVKNRVRSALC